MGNSSESALLDTFFQTASTGNLKGYLDCFSADGVFMGTDTNEEWSMEEFKTYCKKAFAKKPDGSDGGWTFKPTNRRFLHLNPDLTWFHEQLQSHKYGHCRGTGLAIRLGDDWKILRYVLSIAVPNDVIDQYVPLVKGTF